MLLIQKRFILDFIDNNQAAFFPYNMIRLLLHPDKLLYL